MPVTITHVDHVISEIHPDQISAALTQPGFVWIDIEDPDDSAIELLCSEALAIEPLIIEDLVEDVHLPKVDLYPNQVLIVAHVLTGETLERRVKTNEVDIVLGEKYVLSFHSTRLQTIEATRRILRAPGSRLDRPILVAHRILDGLNDEIVPLLDELGDRLDQIEDRVIDTPDEQTADDIFSLRRDLIAVRRFALPQAEAIGRLARVTTELVPAEDHVLFRDVYDHIYRLSEVTESYRQLADSAYDSYLSRREDETNRRITLLTMVSAISLPITVLAGIYGMNFRYMPELTNRWAYPAFWAVVVVLVVVQMLIFRRWGWIGHRGRGRPGRR